jgi:hypothetical protein
VRYKARARLVLTAIKGQPQPPQQQQRMHGGRHSVSDFDPQRPSAANLQNFYANQRYQGRSNEPDQMMQAKRRMAAQRERELRNYHQEQQYNRSEPLPDTSF